MDERALSSNASTLSVGMMKLTRGHEKLSGSDGMVINVADGGGHSSRRPGFLLEAFRF
jgi:hypothetical protein